MYDYAARLIRVLDGDTIEVDLDLGFKMHFLTHVRFLGYDAPELKTDAGFRAKEYLTDLFHMNPGSLTIHTTLNHEFEKYGRVLGAVSVGPINIIAEMIRAGYVKQKEPGT